MAERIIMLVCFSMCALQFLIISALNKDSITPITFWSGGENKLKKQLKNIQDYNYEMALLYKKCAIGFFITGLCSCIHPFIGIALLILDCTIGIFAVYKKYKKIYSKYS